jgi:AraC-like DNA-binding protein
MGKMIDLHAYYLIAALTVSQLLFMGLSYFCYHRQQTLGKLLTLYSVGVAAYVLGNLPVISALFAPAVPVLRMLAIATPAVFWLLTHHLFNDQIRVPRAFWLLVPIYLTLRLLGLIFVAGPISASEPLTRFVLGYLPQTIMLTLVLHACYMAIHGYSADLMQGRQRLRPIFALTMGSIILVIVASGYFAFMNETIRSIYFMAIFVATLVFNLRMFQLHSDFREFISPRLQTPLERDLDNREQLTYRRILDTLDRDAFYAQPGLTLRQLADALPMKEYRLREFINRKLNYRNFNQFINEYRLQHAIDRLERQGEEKVAISTIAWDLGYSSPSSFNKVFKDRFGMTPSEYRKRGQEGVHPGVTA